MTHPSTTTARRRSEEKACSEEESVEGERGATTRSSGRGGLCFPKDWEVDAAKQPPI